MRPLKNILFIPWLLAVTLLLSSCNFFNEREGCEGFIRVVNPIPDTTLTVGSTYERDLKVDPIVFEHTERKTIGFRIFNSDHFTVKATIEGENATTLVLEPLKQGTVTVEVQAMEECDKTASTTFRVTVANDTTIKKSNIIRELNNEI